MLNRPYQSGEWIGGRGKGRQIAFNAKLRVVRRLFSLPLWPPSCSLLSSKRNLVSAQWPETQQEGPRALSLQRREGSSSRGLGRMCSERSPGHGIHAFIHSALWPTFYSIFINPMLGTGDTLICPPWTSSAKELNFTHRSVMDTEIELMCKEVSMQDWLLQASVWHFGGTLENDTSPGQTPPTSMRLGKQRHHCAY